MSRTLAADDATVLAFADSLYERAQVRDGWQETLQELADTFRGTALALHRYDARNRRGTVFNILRAPSMDTIGVDYQEHARDNVWMQRFHAGPLPRPGDVIASHRLLAEADLVRHRYYNEFLKRYGFFASIGAVLEVRQRELTTVTILRDRRPGTFREDEERFLGRVAPHLRNAHRIEQRYAEARSARAALADVLDRLPTAVIALDADLGIVMTNDAADRLLAGGDGVRRVHGRLELADPMANRSLRQAVTGLAHALRGEGAASGGAFVIARPSLLRPFTATAIPVRPLVPGPAAGTACCLLLLEDPEEESPPPERRLVQLWGMTEGEARVAALIAAGLAPREVADELRISFNTVRTHLQRIFAKTDTARQGELVRLLTRLGVAVPEH